EMSAERLLPIGQRNVGMDPAVNYGSTHAYDVGWRSRVFEETVLGRQVTVFHLMYLIVAHRTNCRQNDGILNPLLFHHPFEFSAQIRVVFETEDDQAFETGVDGVPAWHLAS